MKHAEKVGVEVTPFNHTADDGSFIAVVYVVSVLAFLQDETISVCQLGWYSTKEEAEARQPTGQPARGRRVVQLPGGSPLCGWTR